MKDSDNGVKLSRRERERLARRGEILDAARRVFGARGYDGATLAEIAQKAEFAKGTLYSYFGSKAELFTALVERGFGELIGDARAAMAAEEDGAGAVGAAIDVLLRYFEEQVDFFRMVMAFRGSGTKEDMARLRDIIVQRVTELAGLVGMRLADGARAGVFKDYDTTFMGVLLIGMVHNYTVYKFKSAGSEGIQKGAAMLRDIFLDGVRRHQFGDTEDR